MTRHGYALVQLDYSDALFVLTAHASVIQVPLCMSSYYICVLIPLVQLDYSDALFFLTAHASVIQVPLCMSSYYYYTCVSSYR